MKAVLLVFAAFSAYCCAESLPPREPRIVIFYTIENLVTDDDRTFQVTLPVNTTSKPFILIMDEAAEKDSRYEYETYHHEDHGHFVIEINKLHEDQVNGYFWALLKRDQHPDGDCSLHVGISHYEPVNGEHLVFAYETYDLLDRIPVCEQ